MNIEYIGTQQGFSLFHIDDKFIVSVKLVGEKFITNCDCKSKNCDHTKNTLLKLIGEIKQ